MKFGPLVFLSAFFALSASWYGFVLTPQVQLGQATQATNLVVRGELYPQGRPGLARQGLEVYRANGCAYCHSQQVQQQGTLVDVILTDVGANSTAVADVLNQHQLGNYVGPGLAGGLPKTIVRNITMEAATTIAAALKNAGAKTELHLEPIGPDIARGWGTRRTVAEDFLFDATVMPGSQRVGPDLANIGVRSADVNTHLRHLLAPRLVTGNSPMPSYRFLFEERKIGAQPSFEALPLSEDDRKQLKLRDGFEIVPKSEARSLAAYLVSLRSETPLYVAPLTPPPAATNAPATNAPAK